MKNTLTILLLLITLNTFAQNQFIGIEGGLTQTNIDVKNTRGKPYERNGFSFGLNYEYLLKSPFLIGASLNYNQKGFKDKVNITDIDQNYIDEVYFRHNFDYISIPLKTGITLGSKFFGFVKIGIVPSILVSSKLVFPEIDQNGKSLGDKSVSLVDETAKFDMAGLGEIGGGFNLANKYRLFTTFGYQQSFTSISASDEFLASGVTHRGFSLSLGLSYLIKRD